MAKKGEPTEVVITEEQKPVPVTVASGSSLPATTTEEGDRTTAGQRAINRLWERTQASIAILVTVTTCFVLAFLTIVSVLRQTELSANALLLVGYLVVMATTVLTSYFTRTNHDKVGGVGSKPKPEVYVGR